MIHRFHHLCLGAIRGKIGVAVLPGNVDRGNMRTLGIAGILLGVICGILGIFTLYFHEKLLIVYGLVEAGGRSLFVTSGILIAGSLFAAWTGFEQLRCRCFDRLRRLAEFERESSS